MKGNKNRGREETEIRWRRGRNNIEEERSDLGKYGREGEKREERKKRRNRRKKRRRRESGGKSKEKSEEY